MNLRPPRPEDVPTEPDCIDLGPGMVATRRKDDGIIVIAWCGLHFESFPEKR